MSVVIRDAIIRLKIELEKSRLNAPEVTGINRAYEEQTKAATETAKAVKEGIRVQEAQIRQVGNLEYAHKKFGIASVRSMGETTEGVMSLMRGFALMSASGQKDMAAMLGSIVKIEAAMAFVRGASGLAKLAAAFGPVGVAVGAVTATVGAGVMMWSRYTERQREAIEMAKKHREEARKLEQQLADNWREQHNREAADRSRRQAGFELRREAALTPEQESQITSAAQRRIDEERKSISKHWRQRMGGFRDTDEGFSQLTQFGRTANWENARNLEQRKADLAQRQYNLDKERFERERERQDFAAGAQATAFGAATAGGLAFGLPGIGATAGLNTVNTENARIMQKLLESQNQMLNKAVDAYDKAAERITELERRLAGSQN